MPHLADTDALVADGVLTEAQAEVIRNRSRDTLVAVGVNTILSAGIVAAALGLVFWLADVTMVAVVGAVFLLVGAFVLFKGQALYRMLGNAGALIGAGMLLGGATLKSFDVMSVKDAGILCLVVGMGVAVAAFFLRKNGVERLGFALSAVVVLGAGMHLVGAYALVMGEGRSLSVPPALVHLYAALVLLALGYLLDLRVISALAIGPFAQMLDTSTSYFHAAYVFYSPEPALSVLQMTLALAVSFWLVQYRGGRIGRHAGIFAIMAFIVGNLCFLVGSLWGSTIGESRFMARYYDNPGDWSDYQEKFDAFRATTIHISAGTFSVIWAIALVAALAYAMFRGRRGLFNAALTFGAIHAYTQLFESFTDLPLAFVIAGLSAVPLAWGLWRANAWFQNRQAA